jgi:hypothetical protein
VKLVFQTSRAVEPPLLGEWRRLGEERPTLALLRQVSVSTEVTVSWDQARVWRDSTPFERAHASLLQGKAESEFRARAVQIVPPRGDLYSGDLELRIDVRTEHFDEKSYLGAIGAIVRFEWELRQHLGTVGGDGALIGTRLPVFHGNVGDFCAPLAITDTVNGRLDEMFRYFDAAVAGASTTAS